MKVSTQTSLLAQRYGDKEAVRILAANGYDCADYSMFEMNNPDCYLNHGDEYIRHAKELRRIADECGITFNQTHAPFASYIVGNDEYNTFIVGAIKRAIEISGILGAKTCVVHPISRNDQALQKEQNLELYHALEPVCAANGVKAALENMWGWNAAEKRICDAACSRPEQFNEYLDELGYENFTACLDLGHCGLVGNQDCASMIRAMGGKRITALHVHDNDGIHDSHTLPFTMSMNWPEIVKALHDIGYSGEITFEADDFLARFPGDLVKDASKFMLAVGRRLAESV